MIKFLLEIWYLWALVLLAALFQIFKPVIKGWFGEKTIALYLSRLPKDEYKILGNIMLTTEAGTTQIDHIVVSLYGIFIIETKNYKGWIYGSEKSAQWTQNIYGRKSNFLNPLRQNFAHVKAVEAHLGLYAQVPIISIVAFSANCDLKVKTTSHVVYFHQVNRIIQSYDKKEVNLSDITAITDILRNQNITSSTNQKAHVTAINEKKKDIEQAVVDGNCPKCSGVLVERKGKLGSFIGCSNYPKCKFTKQL